MGIKREKMLVPVFHIHPALVVAFSNLPQTFRPQDLWRELKALGAVEGEYSVGKRANMRKILQRLEELGLVTKIKGTWDYTKNYASFETWARGYLPNFFRKIVRGGEK